MTITRVESIQERLRQERIVIGTKLEEWMDEASTPYKKVAQAEHAILKLKHGEAL